MDVFMNHYRHKNVMACQITGNTTDSWADWSASQQWKHKNSTILAFINGFQRWSVGPVTLYVSWRYHVSCGDIDLLLNYSFQVMR